MVAQITKLDNPRSIQGGLGLQFTMATTAGDTELAVPVAELGGVLQFFAAMLTQLSPGHELVNDPFPIPADGIGFQDGEKPGTKILMVRVGTFGFAFEIENSALASMGRELSRIATALAADDQGKPN